MAEINKYYNRLQGSYLFAEIDRRVNAYVEKNPEKAEKLIRLGIGDVTKPIGKAVTKAMHQAVDEMADEKTFMGYGPYQGYDFLRSAVRTHDYKNRGIDVDVDEIFISDGAKSDTGNIGDIFSMNNIAAIGDPVYPVYLDTNVMAGRSGEFVEGEGYSNIIYMKCTEENGFLPEIPTKKADLIYLCFPNNPTGVTADKAYLEKWVAYANENGAVILYDSAYEAYVQEPSVPRSIYEIQGAKTCAIEFRSFSKTAGFTGTRCAYTVVPKALMVDGAALNTMWLRRQSTKFNGVPYIVQKGAEAVYSPEGKKETQEAIGYYMKNAGIIRTGLEKAGLTVYGGENAPYIWFRAPGGAGSWAFFDRLLNEAGVVTTPGVGFGACGEGFIRVTAFGNKENTLEAVKRIQTVL